MLSAAVHRRSLLLWEVLQDSPPKNNYGRTARTRFVTDCRRAKISLCVPWPNPTESNFAFSCSYINQSFARWQLMMNIFDTFPREAYVKIAFLDASIVALNSQIGNSDLKKKNQNITTTKALSYRKQIVLNIQKPWKQEEAKTKPCHFPPAPIHSGKMHGMRLYLRHNTRTQHSNQGCREK